MCKQLTNLAFSEVRVLTQLILLGLACLNIGPANAQLHLGLKRQPVQLQELHVQNGTVVEKTSRLAAELHPSEPLLILYVPATRTARDCVLKVIEPLKKAGAKLLPIRIVNILDVSQLNIVLDWIVTYYYEQDLLETANKRARFFLDRKGITKKKWRLGSTKCGYTLYHPTLPPLSGDGSPSAHFLQSLEENLKPPR